MKKLTKTFKGMTEQNITQTYHEGHKALDIVSYTTWFQNKGYGTPLCAMERSLVLEIVEGTYTPDDTTELKRGYGVWLRGLETGQSYLYWHTLPILPVSIGETIERGKIVAFMGNAGYVTVGGEYVPIEKRTTTKDGTHLHLEGFGDGYKVGRKKNFINVLPQIDWDLEPTYTNAEHIKAISIVAGKTLKLIS